MDTISQTKCYIPYYTGEFLNNDVVLIGTDVRHYIWEGDGEIIVNHVCVMGNLISNNKYKKFLCLHIPIIETVYDFIWIVSIINKNVDI